MRRVLKIFAALIGLAVVAVIGLIVFLPTERIVALAGDQVRAATGRDLTATGAITPSFYPILGVEIGEVALSNAEWAETPQMVTAGGVKVGVELLSLIGGDIKVSEVRLVDPVVALEIGPDGVGNWVFDTGAPAEAAPSEGGLPEGLSFGEISIENAALSFRDQRDGTLIEAEALNAEISLPALDQTLTIAGDASRADGTVTLDVKGVLGLVDRLIEGGVLPEAAAGAYRALALQYTRAGDGPDHLISDIVLRNGAVTINGLPVSR